MAEQTLIFHRATLPDETVLLPPPDRVTGAGAVLTVTAVQRNGDGALVGSHIRELDTWPVSRYQIGFGDPTGQTNYRHRELTVWRGQIQETIELARGGELTVEGVAVNEDGHRTQPHLYRVPFDGLEGITIGEYALKPAGRNHGVLGLIVGKQRAYDTNGSHLGWVPVYSDIHVPGPETAAV